MFHLGYYWWLVGITNIYQNLGDLTRSGDFTWRVSDWWRHLRKHIGINEANYFMYRWVGPVGSPLPLFTQVQAAPASQSSQHTALHRLPE